MLKIFVIFMDFARTGSSNPHKSKTHSDKTKIIQEFSIISNCMYQKTVLEQNTNETLCAFDRAIVRREGK